MIQVFQVGYGSCTITCTHRPVVLACLNVQQRVMIVVVGCNRQSTLSSAPSDRQTGSDSQSLVAQPYDSLDSVMRIISCAIGSTTGNFDGKHVQTVSPSLSVRVLHSSVLPSPTAVQHGGGPGPLQMGVCTSFACVRTCLGQVVKFAPRKSWVVFTLYRVVPASFSTPQITRTTHAAAIVREGLRVDFKSQVDPPSSESSPPLRNCNSPRKASEAPPSRSGQTACQCFSRRCGPSLISASCNHHDNGHFYRLLRLCDESQGES